MQRANKKANLELTVLPVGFQSPQLFSSIIIQIEFQDTSLKLYTDSSEQSLCWLNEGKWKAYKSQRADIPVTSGHQQIS